MNSLLKLNSFGQSIWLDFMRRDFVTGGALQKLIKDDGLAGMTSNPSIFEKAMGGGNEYANAIRALKEKGLGATEIYETLAIEDIRSAADLFKPVFEATEGLDGFVSLEVSPYLALDTAPVTWPVGCTSLPPSGGRSTSAPTPSSTWTVFPRRWSRTRASQQGPVRSPR